MLNSAQLSRQIIKLNKAFIEDKASNNGKLRSFLPVVAVSLAGTDATSGRDFTASLTYDDEMFFVGFGHSTEEESSQVSCAFLLYKPEGVIVISLCLGTAKTLFKSPFEKYYDECLYDIPVEVSGNEYGDQQWG